MDISIQSNGVLYLDRFSKSNSALRITSGYGTFPSGSYFDSNTGFTFMSWVNLLVVPDTNTRLSIVIISIKINHFYLDFFI